jgi:crotonobetainyl-CoA:carnitine CoA-transferase CaiB-like acyl-CoA transferase
MRHIGAVQRAGPGHEPEDLFNDERFATFLDCLKPENAQALRNVVTQWVASKTCDEIVAMGNEKAFPAAAVVDDFEICMTPGAGNGAASFSFGTTYTAIS